MKILDLHQTPQADAVSAAVATLKAGGLLIFPTETTYGAGVDATNQAAVNKLLQYKSRREGKPLSIAVTDQSMAQEYVEVTESAQRLYQRFLPGPMTVVSKSLGKVAPGVESEFGTLGVRIPDYPLVLEIVKQLGRPMTATSANVSDAKRPYQITDVLGAASPRQQALIDLILDAGTLPPNPPSTVVDTTLSTPVVFRQGALSTTSPTPAPAPTGEQHTRLVSYSEAETKAIAGKLLLKHWTELKDRGLVIGLHGSLGMGKTIFAKGVAAFLQISDTLTSPTYSYIEEYPYTRHGVSGMLYHLDVWKIETEAEFARLDVAALLQPRHVVVIEWMSQVQSWLQPLIAQHQSPVISVTFETPSESLSSTPTTQRVLDIVEAA